MNTVEIILIILEIQFVTLLALFIKIKYEVKDIEHKQNLYYEGYQTLFKLFEVYSEGNREIVKLLEDHNYKIVGLNERLKNTEECYIILKNRFNNSEIVYTGGCDPANGSVSIIKTIKENEQEKGK